MSQIERFSKEVISDLTAQQDLGVRIPSGAFERARNLETLAQFETMKASACADLLVQLANLV
jgi:hypothetical protein